MAIDPVRCGLLLTVMASLSLAPAQAQTVVGFTEDADNYLILLHVTAGRPFVYYMGAGWDRGLDLPTAEAWDAYVAAQHPDFAAAPTSPPEP